MKTYRLKPFEKREIVGGWDKPIWLRRTNTFIVPWFCWVQAEKGGGPVLIDDASWRKISGLQVHVGTWQLWIHWRRWGGKS